MLSHGAKRVPQIQSGHKLTSNLKYDQIKLEGTQEGDVHGWNKATDKLEGKPAVEFQIKRSGKDMTVYVRLMQLVATRKSGAEFGMSATETINAGFEVENPGTFVGLGDLHGTVAGPADGSHICVVSIGGIDYTVILHQ
jgi:hypothetical protein